MTIDHSLPLTEIVSPDEPTALATIVANAFESGAPIYPLGGQTSLDYGATVHRPGIGLSLAGLTKIIDYPARDMTITVEAGVKLAELARVLAAERQWLPVCGPQPEQATIGGLMATAWSDGRRYGWGTMRDYVIGMRAVDGRGMPFKAGGRVVKNVAGYDLCKLLTGSLGTVGIITEVTLKLKPLPERTSFVACAIRDLNTAETILARLATTATSPAAIELLIGSAWSGDILRGDSAADSPLASLETTGQGYLLVGLDGAAAEVEWLIETLGRELRDLGVERLATIDGQDAARLWARLRDFSASTGGLTVKASVAPSRVCAFVAECLQTDSQARILAHAGNGIVLARFAAGAFAGRGDAGLSIENLLSRLRTSANGRVSIVAMSLPETGAPESRSPETLTNELVWGLARPELDWMNAVKQQFDPRGILNPGRLAFGSQ